MDPRDSVLQAAEFNDPTETRYPGHSLQNKYMYNTRTQHGTRSIELVTISVIIQTQYINRHIMEIMAEKNW